MDKEVKTTSILTEEGWNSIYADEDNVTFDVLVTPNDDDDDRYKPVELSRMCSVMIAADDGEKILVSFKGECVPSGYDSPVGWLWTAAVVLARIRMMYENETPRDPTDEEVVALLCQAIEEHSQYMVTELRKAGHGE